MIKAPDGRRERRARDVGINAPASPRARLPARPAEPCVFATWKPFFFMWGDGRLSGIDNSTYYARGKPECNTLDTCEITLAPDLVC